MTCHGCLVTAYLPLQSIDRSTHLIGRVERKSEVVANGPAVHRVGDLFCRCRPARELFRSINGGRRQIWQTASEMHEIVGDADKSGLPLLRHDEWPDRDDPARMSRRDSEALGRML